MRRYTVKYEGCQRRRHYLAIWNASDLPGTFADRVSLLPVGKVLGHEKRRDRKLCNILQDARAEREKNGETHTLDIPDRKVSKAQAYECIAKGSKAC